jgi:hypothetical protein
MTKTFDYTALYGKVSRSLSIIAKRSTDENGNRLFADITLGTNEKGIIEDYFRQAVIDLVTELEAFITAETDTSFTVTLPSNHKSALEPSIGKSCDEYCVSYALYSWFTISAPRIADKYLGDMKRQLSAVIRLVNEKEAPTGSADIVSSTSTVIT